MIDPFEIGKEENDGDGDKLGGWVSGSLRGNHFGLAG